MAVGLVARGEVGAEDLDDADGEHGPDVDQPGRPAGASATRKGPPGCSAGRGVPWGVRCGVRSGVWRSPHTGTVPSGPLAVIAPGATRDYHGGSRAAGRAYDGERHPSRPAGLNWGRLRMPVRVP